MGGKGLLIEEVRRGRGGAEKKNRNSEQGDEGGIEEEKRIEDGPNARQIK